MILVIAEQNEGTLNRASWEAVAAAQGIGDSVKIVVLGGDTAELAAELAGADVAEVLNVDHATLRAYTPDAFVQALVQVIGAQSPAFVILPHTYQTRDFAPALATRLACTLVTDCVAIKTTDDGPVFVRPMFQGKLHADVKPLGDGPHLVTIQIGA